MAKETNYDSLKKKLEEGFKWPGIYMFKFIIPSENKKIAQVESLFDKHAEINTKESKNKKYISITIKADMDSPEKVIEKYKAAQDIEGIIAL